MDGLRKQYGNAREDVKKMKKAVMYINQFFGQIGGEERADYAPEIRTEAVGPAKAIAELMEDTEIAATVICGDNFMGSHTEAAVTQIIEGLKGKEFDLFLAGPAFQAGRYGVACGQICKAVRETFGVPVITSMHEENPGVEMFRQEMYILKGSRSSARMRRDLKAMADFAGKILSGAPLMGPEQEGYYKRGIRHQVFDDSLEPAAERAVDMLKKKLRGEMYVSELPMPEMDRVPVAKAINDLSKATIALMTTGGIVPVDNPDRIQSASATRWGRYDISHTNDLESGIYKTIHAGFDPAAADSDPDVVAPVDVLKEYEKEGKFGHLHEYFYSTVGTGTTQAEAQRMAREMLPYLEEGGVDGVIMVST